MSDGDRYQVCGCCGTEFLERAMRRMTASGIYYCVRCADDDPDDEPAPLEPTDVIGPPPADDREENELADRRHDLGGEGG